MTGIVFTKLPDTELLRCLFRYDKDTGDLIRRVTASPNAKAGDICTNKSQRYRIVYIEGRTYVQHRVIWKMVTGEDPECEIDHKNRDGFDNRWCNLRSADRSLNCTNQRVRKDNKQGRNIHFCNRSGEYVVQIQRDNKRVSRRFRTRREAEIFRDQILGAHDVYNT